ncbi:GAF domain-containing sensor histidine kinase [Amycolatopsis sp. FDAARGOS 1241]|uniref:GAF domain-containing sensor histidine kinase n=1 Tax=Amycolatopsis sp. FDAARGOS 1241 TaxID=2778070 RepID=UPI0019524B50|nr:GAF domain-containing sensor histidine kinase [Amycolatopsis sp. FDAARGOS 1241]QRP49415.1 GAF domain-containing protein [Amycolatopsis sp. FDAARGOS 1241]
MSEHDESEPGRLTFPDQPRLELDQLLAQLVERAQEVIGTEGRLRGLLRATQVITSDLALPALLRRIVDAGRQLIGARYAALGVIGSDGRLMEFVHDGMPPDVVARVGHLPEGKGLLGALIEDPRPIRLTRLQDDPRSIGFPAGHPQMESFLGVPIRVRGAVFGNLYLADRERGRFTAEDEQLALALAAAAGSAIDNARLYETARSQQAWLRASAAVARELLAPDSGSPLDLVANHTRELAAADLVTIIRPIGEDGTLQVDRAVGLEAETLVGAVVPADTTIAGAVFASGKPMAGSWPEERRRLATDPVVELDLGAVLAVPLTGAGRVSGVLAAARRSGRPAFTEDDLEMAAAFADQAAVAIELAQARAEQQRNALHDERDRIAAELHGEIVQRLYAAALSLQTTAGLARTPTVATRLRRSIADLDDIIHHVQDTVFRLDEPASTGQTPLRDEVLRILADATPLLGFAVATRFTGKLDAYPADAVVPFLDEALRVIARHASATAVVVEIRADPARLVAVVRCDGPAELARESARELAAMAERAHGRGGTLAVERVADQTRLSWSVPG